jgi:hypothetical protein
MRQAAGKECPWDQRGKGEQRIWDAVGWHLRKFAKEKAKNDHCKEWLQNGPGCSQHCLFVTDFDISPAQKIKEFPVNPQFP